MSFNRLNFDSKITDCVKQIQKGTGDIKWVLFGNQGRNDKNVKFVESGEDYEDLVDEIIGEPTMLLFAFHKFDYETCEKFVFYSWCHESYPRRQDFVFVDKDVERYLKGIGGYHVHYIAHEDDDLEIEKVLKEVERCAGASYRDESTKGKKKKVAPKKKPVKKVARKKVVAKKKPVPKKKVVVKKKKQPPKKVVPPKTKKTAAAAAQKKKKKDDDDDEIKKITGYSEEELTRFVEGVENYTNQIELRLICNRLKGMGGNLVSEEDLNFKDLSASQQMEKLGELIGKLEGL